MIYRDLLTLKETASILRVKYPRVAELARQGIIPVVRLGRQIRIDPEQLDVFVRNGGKALPGGWRRSQPETL